MFHFGRKFKTFYTVSHCFYDIKAFEGYLHEKGSIKVLFSEGNIKYTAMTGYETEKGTIFPLIPTAWMEFTNRALHGNYT